MKMGTGHRMLTFLADIALPTAVQPNFHSVFLGTYLERLIAFRRNYRLFSRFSQENLTKFLFIFLKLDSVPA